MANVRRVNTLVYATQKSCDSMDPWAFDRLIWIAFGSSNFSNINCTFKAKSGETPSHSLWRHCNGFVPAGDVGTDLCILLSVNCPLKN